MMKTVVFEVEIVVFSRPLENGSVTHFWFAIPRLKTAAVDGIVQYTVVYFIQQNIHFLHHNI